MHVIDFTTATHGPLSSEPVFQALFAKTHAAWKSGESVPAFPTTYSRQDVREFFAECATAYLNGTLSSADSHNSRTRLKETDPEAYAYFERLFGERLPAPAFATGEEIRSP